ncbi:MAG: hypothetical protein LH629_06265 [Ignavibacteria bacterium]|nr:hypothetical protein [Ignavibacteria bacterium]
MKILLYTGLIIFISNYLIGWLLYFEIITMQRMVHQIFFFSIIINLILVLIFVNNSIWEYLLCTFSLISILILPFGKSNRDLFHRFFSSTGMIFYFIMFLIAI